MAGQGWGPASAFAEGINGAYWTTASFADTGSGDAVAAILKRRPAIAERHFELLLDMADPGSVRSGYELRFTETAANIYTVALERYVAEAPTSLATKGGVPLPEGDRLALVDKCGTVSAWTASATGEYTQILSAGDSTFSSGYAGVAAAGNGTRSAGFRAEQLAPS